MFEITVVKFKANPDSDYIGRGSALGNPFPITRTDSRDKVCDQYYDYFYDRLNENHQNSAFVNELKRLYEKGTNQGYLKLGCFCKDNNEDKTRCHGDTIRDFFIKNQDNFFNHE